MTKSISRPPNRTAMSQTARWLLTTGGLTNESLGAYLGKSGGWVHHLARANWASGIALTHEQARWLSALKKILQAQHKASKDELAMLEDIKLQLGQVIGQVDNLARRLSRRKLKC